MFTTRTNRTINTVKRMISMPKRRMPTAKAVAGGFSARLVARLPSAVLFPVRQTTIVEVPLITEVPAKTAFDAPAGLSAPARKKLNQEIRDAITELSGFLQTLHSTSTTFMVSRARPLLPHSLVHSLAVDIDHAHT